MSTGVLKLVQARPATWGWLDELIRRDSDPLVSREWDWRNHGFGERIIPACRTWRAGERVLDAGCGYSPLPSHLARTYGVEMWSADDFGGDDTFWRRGQDPDILARNELVRHVFEPIGAANSSLPEGYFDVAYTKLGLHIAPAPQMNMWRHFGSLISGTSGSSLIVLANIGFATDGDPYSALDRLADISRLEGELAEGLARDGHMPATFWENLERDYLLRQSSAFLYCGLLAEAFGVRLTEIPSGLRAETFCCDPSLVVDPHYDGLLQAAFTRDVSRMDGYVHGRRTPVLYEFSRS